MTGSFAAAMSSLALARLDSGADPYKGVLKAFEGKGGTDGFALATSMGIAEQVLPCGNWLAVRKGPQDNF